MRYRAVVAWGMVLAAVGGAYLVQRIYGKPAMKMDVAVRGSAADRVPVEMVQAEVVSLASTTTYTGAVAAYAEEDVYPRVTGRIVEMRVYPGDRVDPGQIVARLDDIELSSKVREAVAAAAAAEANLAQMEADVLVARQGIIQMEKELAMAEAEAGYQQSVAARDERLFTKGAISQQEAENSRAMAAAARAKVEAARAKLDQAKAMEASALRKRDAMAAMLAQSQAMLRTNEVVRDYVNIRAASSGYVAKRLIAPGTLVQPGMIILKIAQIDRVRFQANVAERDVARLRVGSSVRVRPAAGDGVLDLRVTSVFPFAEGPSRTAVVETVAENRDRRFLPGQYVVMEFELGDRADVVSVPRRAVQRVGDQTFVWASGSETAVRRPVKVGPADADRVGILSGLQPGDHVIVAGHENLHEGAKIAVANGAALAKAGAGPGVAGRGPQPADSPPEEHRGHAMAAEGEAAALQIRLVSPSGSLRPGNHQVRIEVRDAAGAPISNALVEVLPGMAGMPGTKLTARSGKEPGTYETAVNLGMAGAWTLEVNAARLRGGRGSAKFNLEAK